MAAASSGSAAAAEEVLLPNAVPEPEPEESGRDRRLTEERAEHLPERVRQPDALPSTGAIAATWAKMQDVVRGDSKASGLGVGKEICEEMGELCSAELGEGSDDQGKRQRQKEYEALPQQQDGAAVAPPDKRPEDMSKSELIEALRLAKTDMEGLAETTVSSRATCLVLLLLLQSSSSMVLEHFAALTRVHPTIFFFLTMLVGAGGNAGCQSAVQVVRQLTIAAASRNAKEKPSIVKILFHEMSVGACLAVVLSLVSLVRCFAFNVARDEVFAITLSLVMIVFASTTIGTILPIALDKVGLDPAHGGAAVQVLMDIGGVLITCVISSLVLDMSEEPVTATPTLIITPTLNAASRHFLRANASQVAS